mmetsp:Transcript_10550/g.24814  ORF Transcript_10550/g.24814 Transcript_10550/m.24814 type:complete len:144 (+) Transcript_10550:48-479(+)
MARVVCAILMYPALATRPGFADRLRLDDGNVSKALGDACDCDSDHTNTCCGDESLVCSDKTCKVRLGAKCTRWMRGTPCAVSVYNPSYWWRDEKPVECKRRRGSGEFFCCVKAGNIPFQHSSDLCCGAKTAMGGNMCGADVSG